MAKKLIVVWLTLLIVLFSSVSIYADDNYITGEFFEKHIVVNGEEIVNYNLQYPFVIYNNSTYVPLTPEICEIFGITAKMDKESRTLILSEAEPTRKNLSSNALKNNNQDIWMAELSDVTVLAYIKGGDEKTEQTKEAEQTETVMIEKEVDLDGHPILKCGKFYFVPLREIASPEIFNWTIAFDSYYGTCVSTDESIPANTYINAAETLRNKGLVAYMKRISGNTITTSIAQQYLFLFKRAGVVYGTDPELLMAIASRESNFNLWATSRSGARGMMQIMDSTGERYGLSVEELYNAKINIDFGAMYISERINAYGGDIVKGLSAYNQGSVRVNRGSYSTAYANRVIGEFEKIQNYLSVSGYVL